VRVGGLRNPPANGFYEVWLGAPGRRLSLGKLVVGSDGRATVTLNMPANTRHEYPWVWITRERDDGNAAPSPDTVLKGSIA